VVCGGLVLGIVTTLNPRIAQILRLAGSHHPKGEEIQGIK